MGLDSLVQSLEQQHFKEFLPEIVPERGASVLPLPPAGVPFQLEVSERAASQPLTPGLRAGNTDAYSRVRERLRVQGSLAAGFKAPPRASPPCCFRNSTDEKTDSLVSICGEHQTLLLIKDRGIRSAFYILLIQPILQCIDNAFNLYTIRVT